MSVRGLRDGRVVTDEAKRQVCDRLWALWCSQPEMRLGQLILNYYRTDFYMVEDGEFITYLEAFYQSLEQNESING